MIRKPITSAVVGSMLVAICDDGSVWELDPGGGWVQRQPIPGTQADMQAEVEVRLKAARRASTPRGPKPETDRRLAAERRSGRGISPTGAERRERERREPA